MTNRSAQENCKAQAAPSAAESHKKREITRDGRAGPFLGLDRMSYRGQNIPADGNQPVAVRERKAVEASALDARLFKMESRRGWSQA